ncbi:MAG: hypothetical protein JWR24_5125 [Actinoallomurus sp.]|jgi:hypothetical protein|nr:hypothetical protein [Actinoallomurus sp.]
MTNPDLYPATWRKRSRSGNGGNCVEFAVVYRPVAAA